MNKFEVREKDRDLVIIRSTLKLMDKFARERNRQNLRKADYLLDPSLVEFELKNPYEGLQRHRRYFYEATATVALDGVMIEGAVRNISSSGLFIEADMGIFAVNDKVIVDIYPIDDAKAYKAVARVVRIDSECGGYGLKFATFE